MGRRVSTKTVSLVPSKSSKLRTWWTAANFLKIAEYVLLGASDEFFDAEVNKNGVTAHRSIARGKELVPCKRLQVLPLIDQLPRHRLDRNEKNGLSTGEAEEVGRQTSGARYGTYPPFLLNPYTFALPQRYDVLK